MLPTLATPVFRPMPMSRCGLPSDSHFFCISRTRSIILSTVSQALAAWPGSSKGAPPEGHHRVANVLVQSAVVFENKAGHVRKILIQKIREILSVQFFGNGRETADVAEHHGDIGFFRFDEARIYQQAPDDFGAEV